MSQSTLDRSERAAVAEEHGTIRKNLIALCREHPEVATDYRKLVQYYWYYVDGFAPFIEWSLFSRLTNPESINRAFRDLAKEGTIWVPPEVKQRRQARQDAMRRYYGGRNRQ